MLDNRFVVKAGSCSMSEFPTYYTELQESLVQYLTMVHGEGFSRSNLNYMRLLYRCYPICE